MNITQLLTCLQANEQKASITEQARRHKEQVPYFLIGFHPSTAQMRAC